MGRTCKLCKEKLEMRYCPLFAVREQCLARKNYLAVFKSAKIPWFMLERRILFFECTKSKSSAFQLKCQGMQNDISKVIDFSGGKNQYNQKIQKKKSPATDWVGGGGGGWG